MSADNPERIAELLAAVEKYRLARAAGRIADEGRKRPLCLAEGMFQQLVIGASGGIRTCAHGSGVHSSPPR
jgi:hypothetical protein